MFKKSEKLPPLPKPPTVDQIVEDLDTFKEEGHEVDKFRENPSDSKNLDRDWWRVFHTFMEDNKQLELTDETIQQLKISLIDANTEILNAKADIFAKIEEQKRKLAKIRECWECNEHAKCIEK
uniref:CSON000158 protein n=1 Tax=Culicoides sonorensis TaxID=179676 RepID=A0A336LUG7_CULSO